MCSSKNEIRSASTRKGRKGKRHTFRHHHLLACLLAVVFYPSHFITSAFAPCQHVKSRRLSPLFVRNKSPKMPNIPAFSEPSTSDDTAHHSTSTIVVLDVENIRGANSFRISHEALLTRIRCWREDRLSKLNRISSLEPMVWVNDHGVAPSVHHFSSSPNGNIFNYNGIQVDMPHNFGLAFAGPRTADDVIVDLVMLRCGTSGISFGGEQAAAPPSHSRNTTIVITADARLISRCQQARRQSSSLSDVIFVEPTSLLQQLDVYKLNRHEEDGLFGEYYDSPMPRPLHHIDGSGRIRVEGKTNTMTSFKDSTIAMEQHAKFQARFQNSPKPVEVSSQPIDDEMSVEDDADFDYEETAYEPDPTAAAIAAKLKTEQIRRQLLLSDAYYLAKPSKLRGRRSANAIHAKYKNRNISKTQQQRMYKKRGLVKRRNDRMAREATTRKDLAQRLQVHIEGLVDSVNGESLVGKCRSAKGGSGLLGTLLEWFEGASWEEDDDGNLPYYDELDGLPMHSSSEKDDPGSLESDRSWNPLGSVVRVPLRDSAEQQLAALRIVVISDTHGFEGELARFDKNHPKHSGDYLLPQADLLLHCGDFAASGSRKSQRLAARRLDDFLARQRHISEKIVVKGNHDPDSPARVLFPNSKALYVRAPSTLVVNGVTFALEPYAKRISLRTIRNQLSSSDTLPFCDVLVSHEPPKGVLDLSYHGFSAGSSLLRNLVSAARTKPRLWLCGHIHEGRGMLTTKFHTNPDEESDESKSTLVINAANANSGKANRLVSGAVVIDVERNYVNDLQTAENTVQLRGILEQNDCSEGLAGMENMELYITRPGVRRRKGISQSVRRQKLQQARSRGND